MDDNFDFTSLFRMYDIRAIVPNPLSATIMHEIGCALGTYLNTKAINDIALGRDFRLSSPMFHTALCKGLLSTGMHIIDIGQVSTPMLYFFHANSGYRAACMITASHNPAHYNGLKCFVNKMSLFGDKLQRLIPMMRHKHYHQAVGTHEYQSVAEQYLHDITPAPIQCQDLHIIWDPGHGAVGLILPHVLKKIHARHTVLAGEPDGHFPSCGPDPTEDKRLQILRDTLSATGADICFAFDGDGDRVFILSKDTGVMHGDSVLAFLALNLLQSGDAVVVDIKGSMIVDMLLEKNNIKVYRSATGHAFMKQSMMQHLDVRVAGEYSGHIFFADHNNRDDGLYAACVFLKILADNPLALKEFHALLPQVYTSNNKDVYLTSLDEQTHFMHSIDQQLAHSHDSITKLDGYRVSTALGWYLLRKSNTEAKITVHIESLSKQDYAVLEKRVEHMIEYAKKSLLNASS